MPWAVMTCYGMSTAMAASQPLLNAASECSVVVQRMVQQLAWVSENSAAGLANHGALTAGLHSSQLQHREAWLDSRHGTNTSLTFRKIKERFSVADTPLWWG